MIAFEAGKLIMDLAHARPAYRQGCLIIDAISKARFHAGHRPRQQRRPGEGVYREMKLRRHFEKPSEKRAREHAAAVSRARKADRKRAEKDQ
jgi:small subunit ribosomal protein S21